MCSRWLRVKASRRYRQVFVCLLALSVLLWILVYVTGAVKRPRWSLRQISGPVRQTFSWQSGDLRQPDTALVTEDDSLADVGTDLVLPVRPVRMAAMLEYPPRAYTEKVLLLTPIHNAADHLEHFAKVLLTLSFPRELLTLAWAEDSSTDETMAAALSLHKALSGKFRRVSVIRLNLSGQMYGDVGSKHQIEVQYERRKHLAKARNLLLKSALSDEDWVLWIDSDVKSLPSDLVQQLLSAEKDIVVPLCIKTDPFTHITRVYDRNTWRETPKSLKKQREAPTDKLFLEGYGKTDRLYLNSLRSEGRVVPIDGVGACSLLVRATCHREGLHFPEEIYDHHIETEGLAKMASHKGYGVYGMPFVEVAHL